MPTSKMKRELVTDQNDKKLKDVNSITLIVGDDDKGNRLDQVVSYRTEIPSRSAVQNLIKNEYILVDGKIAKKNQRLTVGQIIDIDTSPLIEVPVKGEDIPITVAYEDNDIIVIDKKAGMVTHPAIGNREGTLVNALLFLIDLPPSGDKDRPGIVHRLDKDTSGLLIVAKNIDSYESLIDQIKNRDVKRYYKVLVDGNFDEESGEIIAPIARDLNDRQKMAVSVSGGKEAVTKFKVIDKFDKTSYLEASLLTGRTHQIRVHMNYIGHKVIGDSVYGTVKYDMNTGLTRQFLHACRLRFTHPISGLKVDIESKLPKDLEEALKFFKNN